MSTHHDISYTYRGYRLQALYALWRILQSDDDRIFQPEGREDLAVLDSLNNLKEVIQVKAHKSALTLSSLRLGESNSFFKRVASHMKGKNIPLVSIISFGEIGYELAQACKSAGKERDVVIKKIVDKEKVTKEQAVNIINNIKVIEAKEEKLKNDVTTVIEERMIDPAAAFENLIAWLFRCSEERTKISRETLIGKIDNIGKFLVDRAAHHREWGLSIFPISEDDNNIGNADELKDEYYRGISARYEHILSNLDVPRHDKLTSIDEEFKSHRVVILHGASGQGKSTLAYRYLHDYYPAQWRYGIRLIEDRKHALSIASALSGYASVVGLPIIVFIDVSGNDKGWEDLVKRLYEHKNILVLVAIREEDYRRAVFSRADFDYSELELYFDKNEAKLIYESLSLVKPSSRFLDFEASWSHCGESVPLLEFVHLIIQGESLKERLSEQVNRIKDEVRENPLKANELEALRLVSVASAYEAKLNIVSLSNFLSLVDPKRTFELFEKEYLLRLSEDNELVYGLHPIRSEILTDLLTDPALSSWKDAAIKCIPLMTEQNLESFLLYAFSRKHSDSPNLIDFLNSYSPNSWTGIAGIVKSLLWLGVKDYVHENESVIHSMYVLFGNSFPLLMDFDLANSTENIWDNLWENSGWFPKENIEIIKAAKAKQTDKNNALKYAKKWLAYNHLPNYLPSSDVELRDMACALLWTGHLGINKQIEIEITEDEVETVINNAEVQTLGTFILGLSLLPNCNLYKQFKDKNSLLRNKYMNEAQTYLLENDNEKITAHFILDLFDVHSNISENINENNKLQDEALFHIELLRKLFPDKDMYACQGYGHQFLQLPFDPTEKTGIQKSLLPPEELTSLNTVLRGRMLYDFRPSDWKEYVTRIVGIRENVVHCFRHLLSGINKYYSKRSIFNVYKENIDTDSWKECQKILNSPPMIPKCAVDEWGFVTEGNIRDNNRNRPVQVFAHHIFNQYKNFLNASQEYFQFLSNYFYQSLDSTVICQNVGRNNKTQDEVIGYAKEQDIAINASNINLSLHSLNDAVKALPNFQKQFSRHLKSLVDQEQLDQLVANESNTMKDFLPLWYFFTQKPKLSIQKAITKCVDKFEKKRKEILRNLRKGFKEIVPQKLVRVELSESIQWWYDKRAFIILTDFKKPYDSILILENVLRVIYGAISKVENNEIRRITLELHYEHFVIIPLIQGKSLNKKAWKFYCHTLPDIDSLDDELSWWKVAPEDIPHDAFETLNLTSWESSKLITPWNLVVATQELVSYSNHLSEFANIGNLDDTGKVILQEYVDRLTLKVNHSFQNIFDYALNMVNFYNSVPDEDKDTREDLSVSISKLSDLVELLNPSGDETIHMEMNLEGIKEWSQSIAEVSWLATLAYWYWAADVIEQEGIN